jgi:hypothetical protein
MSEHKQHQSRDEYVGQEEQYQLQINKNYVKPIVIAVVAVVLISLSFIGGIKYQKGHQPKAPSFSNGSNPFGSGGAPSGGLPSGSGFPGGGSSTSQ